MLITALPSRSGDSAYLIGKSVHSQNVVYMNEFPYSPLFKYNPSLCLCHCWEIKWSWKFNKLRKRGRMLIFEREAIIFEMVEWKLFYSCLFDLGIVMSLICVSVLHLENSNINTRKKIKVTNLLQQHSGVINLYILSSYHPAWISYHKTNKEIEGKPASPDKIRLLFCLKPVLFNLSHLKK